MHISMKYLAALSALFLVAACETAGDKNNMSDGAGVSGDDAGYDAGYNADGSSIRPGSQADLENNVGDRVFFALDSSVLTAEGQSTLERQAAWMNQYSDVRVAVEGHADERGTREYNLALGERRANAVRNYLVGLGVDSSRINTISYGKERPAVLGSNHDAWAQNRRGVTVVE